MSGEIMPTCRFKRVWAVGAAIAFAGVVVLRRILLGNETLIRDLSPGCFVRKITGFQCAGCGGTRALFAFLKGDLALSWRMNPLFLLGLAAAFVFGTMAVWDRLPGGRPRCFSWIRITAGGGWFVLGVTVLFSIVRNFPWWPFTLLSPP